MAREDWISYYKRNVDYINIIFNKESISEEPILHAKDNVNEKLTFKLNSENKNNLNFLNLTICGNQNILDLGTYRKEMNTDNIKNSMPNQPNEKNLPSDTISTR